MDASNNGTARDGHEADHLETIDDGCGCAEVWEQLSEQRNAADDPE